MRLFCVGRRIAECSAKYVDLGDYFWMIRYNRYIETHSVWFKKEIKTFEEKKNWMKKEILTRIEREEQWYVEYDSLKVLHTW